MTKLFIANWKMVVSGLDEAKRLAKHIHSNKDFHAVVCPSFVHINSIEGKFDLGAQNCSSHESGAYTGEVSAKSLADLKVKYVIIGHSERRQYHHETDGTLCPKVTACHRHKMNAVVCIGEPEDIYEQERTQLYLQTQIEEIGLSKMDHKNTIIAYEPLWAIGTGRTPSVEEVDNTIKFIKKLTPQHKVLYGGSVNSSNIMDFYKLKSVDGFLVGGASAKEEELKKIFK